MFCIDSVLQSVGKWSVPISVDGSHSYRLCLGGVTELVEIDSIVRGFSILVFYNICVLYTLSVISQGLYTLSFDSEFSLLPIT